MPARFCAACFFGRDMLGVFFDTFFVGLQYDLLPPAPFAPQGLPDAVFHFSFCHRFRLLPLAVLRTWPFFLRHLATACDARALGHFLYCRLIFFVHASATAHFRLLLPLHFHRLRDRRSGELGFFAALG